MSIQSQDVSQSPLSRIAAPIAIVAGALVIITRLVIILTVPGGDELEAYVLTATHAINSVASIVAFALLLFALIAAYDREARPAGMLGVIAVGAAIIGTVFMAGDWWYEAFAVPRIAEVAPEVVDTFVGGRVLTGGLSSFALFGIGWLLFGVGQPACPRLPSCHLHSNPGWWLPLGCSPRPRLPDWRGRPASCHGVAGRVDDEDDGERNR